MDICKGHGTWFDRDELSHIIEFIRAGGLDLSRAKEKEEIQETRRQLRQEHLSRDRTSILERDELEYHRGFAIASTRGLLKLLLD